MAPEINVKRLDYFGWCRIFKLCRKIELKPYQTARANGLKTLK